MRQYLAGDRRMPLSASGLLAVSCAILGGPVAMLAPWMPPDVGHHCNEGAIWKRKPDR